MPWTPNGLPDELLRAIDPVCVRTARSGGGEMAAANKEAAAAAFERAYRPNWQYH
jgi:hypothetical protein